MSGFALGFALSGRGPTRIDRVARRACLRIRSRPLTRACKALGKLGKTSTLAAVSAVLVLATRDRAERARLVAGPAVRLGLEQSCKHVFERKRPPAWMQLGVKRGCSLPSGHSLASAAFLVFANATRRTDAHVFAVALSVVVGASRVYLEKHNVTDVATGLLLGLGAGCLIEATRQGTSTPHQERKRRDAGQTRTFMEAHARDGSSETASGAAIEQVLGV